VGPVAVVVAAVAGAAGGAVAGPLADRVATPRYGPDTDGFDPEDFELAPLHPPTSGRERLVLVALGGAGTAALAAGVDHGGTVAYLAALYVAYLAAMTVDLQYLRLPNAFTFPATVFAVAGAYALAERRDIPFAGAVAGLLAYAGFLWLTRVAYRLVRGREGMGLGDVKLSLSLGASLGLLGGPHVDPAAVGGIRLVVYAALLGNLLGAVVGAVLLRRFDREFPFGPALVAGWLVIAALSGTLAP
jgi:leader peptidase (prepilin peptidase)/N-methyltransferase